VTTHYDQVPSLEERVRASRLIVVGRVESVELLKRQQIGEIEEQQAIAHIAIRDVLRGEAKTRRIGVRFIAPSGAKARSGVHPFRENQRLLLLLVPDVGRDARPNTFVAYLRGHYPLSAGDSFTTEPAPVSEKHAGSKTSRATLRKLRELIRAVEAAETADERSWARHEPQLARRPALPPITEVPQSEHGAGPTQAVPQTRAARAPRRK
jgi:hypothetical protein